MTPPAVVSLAKGIPMVGRNWLAIPALIATTIAVGIAFTAEMRARYSVAPPLPTVENTVSFSAAPVPPLPPKLVRWSAPLKMNLDDIDAPSATTGVWAPDGKHILTAGHARPEKHKPVVGEVRVWDATSGKVVHTFRGSAGSYAHRAGHLAISADGKTVAAGGLSVAGGGGEGFVEVWDWGIEKPRLKLDGFDYPVTGVAFSDDGKRLAAVDGNGILRVWELARGKKPSQTLLVPIGRGGRTWGLAFHPTRPVLTVATVEEGEAWFFNVVTGETVGEKEQIPTGGLSAAFSPDGKTVAYGGGALCGNQKMDRPSRL